MSRFLLRLILGLFMIQSMSLAAQTSAYKIRIFTAQWCPACVKLSSQFKATSEYDQIMVGNQKFPIEWVDVDSPQYEALAHLKGTEYIPEIQLTTMGEAAPNLKTIELKVYKPKALKQYLNELLFQ